MGKKKHFKTHSKPGPKTATPSDLPPAMPRPRRSDEARPRHDDNDSDNADLQSEGSDNADASPPLENEVEAEEVPVGQQPSSEPKSLLLRYYFGNPTVLPEDQRAAFVAAVSQPLPVTVRIVSTALPKLISYIQDQLTKLWPNESVCNGAEQSDGEPPTTMQRNLPLTLPNSPPRPLSWYPGNGLAWQFPVSHYVLRRDRRLRELRRFVVMETQIGTLVRQETVSLVPALFLMDVIKSDSLVLDMCAAPGGKTMQLMEALAPQVGSDQTLSSGVVVANDNEFLRCEVLLSRTSRLFRCLPPLIVTNHDARMFPDCMISEGRGGEHHPRRIEFDCIMCDVMCSGDGTVRKCPELLRCWTPQFAHAHHPQQIRALLRAMELVRVGGRIVYSTCSVNPIEDEAVVLHCLRCANGSFELVDMGPKFPELKRSAGITQWNVMNRRGKWVKQWEDLSEGDQVQIPQSCFPPDSNAEVRSFHIERCMRFMPHGQDTGGFFVAVLHKRGPMPSVSLDPPTGTPVAAEKPENTPLADAPQLASVPRLCDPFVAVDSEAHRSLKHRIELADSFPFERLFRRQQNIGQRRLFLVSWASAALLQAMKGKENGTTGKGQNDTEWEVAGAGVRVFESLPMKNRRDEYRLTFDGLDLILPFLPSHRIVPMQLADVERLLSAPERKLPVSDFTDPGLVQSFSVLFQPEHQFGGTFAAKCVLPENHSFKEILSDGDDECGGGGAIYLPCFLFQKTVIVYLNNVETEFVKYRLGIT